MRFLAELAWQDLRASGRSLWIFVLCLTLGVTLISASGGLYRLIDAGLLADARSLMGGDVEVDSDAPLPADVLEWIEARGDASLVTELDTMLGSDAGFLRVELQTTDARYPLYGKLALEPNRPLTELTAFDGERWGIAVDPVLAERLDVAIGDLVYIGALEMVVRALVLRQPDRSLNADWRGTPVLLSEAALQASGLVQPGSRIDYDYHVRTDLPADEWRDRFYRAFPMETWEVRTFEDRSRRIAERLGQMASGLIIVSLSTLFIGGLGVFNSIQAYLRGKLGTIATLGALGLRDKRIAAVYLLQVGILSGGASLAGTLTGGGLALAAATVIAADVPMATKTSALLTPAMVAFAFGLLTAYAFALPAIGRALAVDCATLFRGTTRSSEHTPTGWWLAAGIAAVGIVAMILFAIPDAWFGIGFVVVVATLLGMLDLVVRALRRIALAVDDHPFLGSRFSLRLAVANLHRPGTPLRAALLSLGSALTLLVACTLIVGSLLRTINTTIPEESPALVIYDATNEQVDAVAETLRSYPSTARVETAPLVRARITAVNGKALAEAFELDTEELRDASRDEYKLSYRANNIDNVTLVRGSWWTAETGGRPKLAMEDREVGQLGLALGDTVTFFIEGRELDAEIAAVYSQKGLQTRFWFEGILSDGALDGLIHRHVGAAYMDDSEAVAAQRDVAAIAPNVITVRTAELLAAGRDILGKASAGLAVVAGVSLIASLLVLVSVIAAGRSRQVYDATILHSLGTRLAVIRRSLHLEYLLLAAVTSLFSVALGSAIALPLLELRLKLPSNDLLWLGIAVAGGVSVSSLGLGARYLLRRLELRPAVLLRDAG